MGEAPKSDISVPLWPHYFSYWRGAGSRRDSAISRLPETQRLTCASHLVSHPRRPQTSPLSSPRPQRLTHSFPLLVIFHSHCELCAFLRARGFWRGYYRSVCGRGTIRAVSLASNHAPCCYQPWAQETDELWRGSGGAEEEVKEQRRKRGRR